MTPKPLLLSSLTPINSMFDVDYPVETLCTNVRAHCSDSDRTPACMNAVSRERFTPATAADAVAPTNLRATVADFHPT